MGRSKINVKFKSMGASGQVTGSSHLLNIHVGSKEYNIVLDYGLVQDGLKNMNQLYKANKLPKSINWEDVSAVILSHSHA